MAVTAADVKRLRDETGVGPAECKKTLTETNGDFDKAVKILKEKGLAAAAKRADRATNQRRVTLKTKDGCAVLVELASETDFVARNPDFIALGGKIADKILDEKYSETDERLNAMVKDLATTIRENMSLKRTKTIKAAGNQHIGTYVHGDGAIGVLILVSADKPEVFAKEEAKDFVVTLAMHIAAFNPLAISANDIDPALLKEQEELFRKQMESDEKLKGKPANVLEGILKGKLNKYISEICLLDQPYIKDDKITVKQALANEGKKLNVEFKIDQFISFRVGA
ncbi:MAG: translation elongation factor Ts [Spirochaetaceae bacterium]|jgi:elongation factor Ts|nr:translation elongation factor Ts [Spirochaetaceae bacterium]